jgi:hypothetical protein
MKISELTFADGFTSGRGLNNNPHKTFDWDKAAQIIKDRFLQHKDLKAEAGLQKDWGCTGGEIFEDGKPTNGSYTYLCSNWAIPTLILSWDGIEQEELECYSLQSESRFNEHSKWDETSLKILGIQP